MQPIFNLKSFLAVLIILIVPAALLVAYFRNYSAEGGGHEHGGAAASGQGGDMSAMKPSGHSHATQGQGNMAMPQGKHMQSGTEAETAHAQKAGSQVGAEHGATEQSSIGLSHPPSGQMQEPTRSDLTREQVDMAKSSALPGIPGVSRLYHIGAKEFFLNQTDLITLTTKQQAALQVAKRKALLSKFTAQRKIEEAEQELWELTGADKPDTDQIQAKVQVIEKLRGELRMAFIQSVGEAAKVLTDEQRRMLVTGAYKE